MFGLFLVVFPLFYYMVAPFGLAKPIIEPMSFILIAGLWIAIVSAVIIVIQMIFKTSFNFHIPKIHIPINKTQKIKKCPFCGSEPIKEDVTLDAEGNEYCRIKCGNFNCKINPQTMHTITKEAIKIWNKRE
jgi:hypothetical protein